MNFSRAPVFRAQRLIFVRQWQQTWAGWRQSGMLLMGAYLGGFLIVALVSLWQTYRMPAPDLGQGVLAAGLSVWMLSVALSRRPALGLEAADLPFIRWPCAPWKVLLWPLLRTGARTVFPAGALGILAAWWFPSLWFVGVSLPVFAAVRVVVHALLYDSRLIQDRQTAVRTLLVLVLLSLGAVKPPLLPVIAAVQLICLLALWGRFWHFNWHPLPLMHAEVQGLRLGAQKFGLPLPYVGPDGFPPARRLKMPLRGQGPWRAALWRSTMHVLRHPAALALAPLAGLMTATGTPVLLALAVSPLLALLGPPALPDFPLPARATRLARSLPGGLLLGVLLGLGGLGGAALGWVSSAWLVVLLVLPWSALTCSAMLGEAVPGSNTTASQLRFGAAMAPALVAFLCMNSDAALLSPLVVGAVGLVATLMPSIN